ncbi:MAG: hypothetical protein ABIH23_35180, partial [bacterium]
ATLCSQLAIIGCPEPVLELRFHPTRRWRWDLCWPDIKPPLAVEIDGGIWVGGRHTRAQGFRADQEKRNAGVIGGWRILSYVPDEITSWRAAQEIASVVLAREVRIG